MGFEGFADNLIVNFLEDNKEIMKMGEGSISIEKPDGTSVRCVHDGKTATIVVRGYTDNGWMTHEQSVKL